MTGPKPDFQIGLENLERELSEASIFVKRVTLTDAQIKALPTGWVEIVPAPGAGKIIVPIWSTWVVDATAGVYTNLQASPAATVAGCSLYLAWDAPNFYNDASGYVQASGFLNRPTAKAFAVAVGQLSGNLSGIGLSGGSLPSYEAVGNGQVDNGYENAALYVVGQNNAPDNLGNFTGGNAANTLKVAVYYVVVDV